MSEEQKPGKKLKQGMKLKTKPAVVPSQRKIKSKGMKLPAAMMGPQGIKKWNIIFTIIFGALLVLTIIQSYFIELIILPLPKIALNILYPILIFIEVFLVLLAFETFRVTFAPKLIRIILTILTLIVFFPLTLFKYHTRHNIWRIMFVGLTIGTLILSFFSPYFNMIGKYRDLPPGEIGEQAAGQTWFDSLFQGSAPFYLDGFLDLLDSLNLNQTLQDSLYAQVHSPSGQLGDFLYRWEIKDRYDSSTWEFVSNDGVTTALQPEDYGPVFDSMESSDIYDLQITQNVSSGLFTNFIQGPLISTWSNLHENPQIESDSDWDDNLVDYNGTVSSVDGTTDIRFNDRDQFLLESTAANMSFQGVFNYNTYFVNNNDTVKSYFADNSVNASEGQFYNPTFQSAYSQYLDIPSGYATLSPQSYAYGIELKADGEALGNSVYRQALYVIDRILQEQGPVDPFADPLGFQGRDRAEGLMTGEYEALTAFLTLVVMVLRLCDIPARPVYGFALGDGDAFDRDLKLGHLYPWVEILLPIVDDSVLSYYWGQFQIGPCPKPYPDGSSGVYCENTLYSSYNVTFEMLEGPPTYGALTTQEVEGEDMYITEFDITYTLQADVTSDGSPVSGISVTFRSINYSVYDANRDNPSGILAGSTEVGSASTNVAGRALFFVIFTFSNYTQLDILNPPNTAYIMIAQVSLTSVDGAGFFIAPDEGYISNLNLNTTRLSMPNAENITETFNQYIVLKDTFYQVSSLLHEDDPPTIPIQSREVTYYLMTYDEIQDFNATPYSFDVSQLFVLGVDSTDSLGNSSISFYSTDLTLLPKFSFDHTYFVAARFGYNYSVVPIYLTDSVYSTIEINSTNIINVDFLEVTVYLYLQPPGQPEDPFENEPLEIWIVDEDKYLAAPKTDVTSLKNYLISTNSTPGYNLIVTPYALTNSTGHFNNAYQISVADYSVGWFVVLVFYKNTWNISESFEIIYYIGSAVTYTELGDSEVIEDLTDKTYTSQEIGMKYFTILCLLCISHLKKKEVIV